MLSIAVSLALLVLGPPERGRSHERSNALFGLCGAALVGIGFTV